MTLSLPSQVRHYTLLLLLFWSLICLGAGTIVYVDTRREVRHYARESAQEALKKDLVYRHWNAGHGGVYVPLTEKTRPNPYLDNLPARDLVTTDGKRLTLVNPAYMTRQVHELAQQMYGSRGHITSLKPLRPENAPDAWEARALQRFEEGEKAWDEVIEIDGAPHLRAMIPLIAEERCLICHAVQGYQVGDIRGGLSVTVPLQSYLANAAEDFRGHALLLCGLWGGGAAIILFGGRLLTQRVRRELQAQEELAQSERRYRQLFANMDGAFFLAEIVRDDGRPIDYRILAVNAAFEEMSGCGADTLVGSLASRVPVPEEWLWLERFGAAAANGTAENFYHYSHRLEKYLGTRVFSPEPGQFAVLTSDITERMTAELKIKESRQRFEDLVNSTDGIVWELDLTTFCFTFVSQCAESLLGYPVEAWYQPNFWTEHLHPDDRFWTLHHFLEQAKELRNHEFEYRMLTADGRHIWIRDLVSVRSVDGKPVSLCGVMIDITRAKEAEQTLIAATEAANAANRAKSEFLANMSHELRTPLNGVLGMLQLLSQEELPAGQREYVEIASRSGWSLLELLNDLLDLTRIEAGRLPIVEEPFVLEQLLGDVWDLFSVPIAEKHLVCACQFDPQLPAELLGDGARLRQILFNLVGNAVKFTPDGGRIDVRVRGGLPLASGAIPVSFTIADSGIGIPAEMLETIFDPFVQGDAVYRKRYQGAGLGLAIVKRLVAALGGDIQIESQPGVGTTLLFSLPLQTAGARCVAQAAAQAPAAVVPAAPKHILLVEDNAINRVALEKLLRKLGGYRVACAGNGREALQQLAMDDFDLVLMDIQMPVMDGLEALQRIRCGADGIRNPTLPVVALTAYAMESDRVKFLQAGMDDYLAKPIEWRALDDCLRRQLFQV